MEPRDETHGELATAWLDSALSALACRSAAPPMELRKAIEAQALRLRDARIEVDPVRLCFDLLKLAPRAGEPFDPIPYVRVYARWRGDGHCHERAFACLRRALTFLEELQPRSALAEPRDALPRASLGGSQATKRLGHPPPPPRIGRVLNLDDYPGFAQGRRRTPPGAVSIGGASKWAVPFRLGRRKATPEARRAALEESLRCYEEHVRSSPELLAALPELRGNDLACWCAPRPCRGDVLLALLAETAHEPPGSPERVRRRG